MKLLGYIVGAVVCYWIVSFIWDVIAATIKNSSSQPKQIAQQNRSSTQTPSTSVFVKSYQDDSLKYNIYSLNGIQTATVTGCVLFDIPNKLIIPETILDNIKVRKIGEKAFYGIGLKEVVLPETIIEIGKFAFTSIEKINLPESLVKICYAGLSSMLVQLRFNEIYIKKGMVIEGKAFEHAKIHRIILDPSCKCLGEAFCFTDIEHIEFEYGTHTLYTEEFAYCKVDAVKLPYGITEIPDGLFRNSTIKRVCIPSSVNKISDTAFTETYETTPRRLDGSVDLRYNPSFSRRNLDVTVYCDAGSYAQQFARDHRFNVRPSSEYKE